MTRHHHDFVLLHPSRAELLAVPQDGGLSLPHSSSDDFLETPDLLKILRDLVPLDARMLRPAQLSPAEPEKGQDRTRLYVLEAQADGPLPEGARWLGAEAMDTLAHPERAALATILREDAEPSRIPALRPDWARRGWHGEVKSWLGAELTRLGREPLGDPIQLKVWGLSAVLRQRTDQGDVYFKAAMEHFIAEPRITAAVAGLFPDIAPTVLALEPLKGWTLLEPFRGRELNEAGTDAQQEVFRRYSALQLESVAYKGAFMEAGCADRSLDKLKSVVPWLFRESLELDRLTSEEREQLLVAEPRILDMIGDLAACDIPETLVHGDIHFGNIVTEGDAFTIFDWTDACWSHPFFDIALQYSHDRSAAERGPLVEAYLEPWLAAYDEVSVRRALTFAENLSPLFYAQSYEGIGRALAPGSGGDFAGVVANFLKALLRTRTKGRHAL